MSAISHPAVLPAVLPAARARAARPRSGVRLTRRGRLAVFLLAVVVLAGLFVFWPNGSVATSDSGAEAPSVVLTVGTGQTLWGIASEIAEDGEVRATMREIERLNALESTMLVAGQQLRVPRG